VGQQFRIKCSRKGLIGIVVGPDLWFILALHLRLFLDFRASLLTLVFGCGFWWSRVNVLFCQRGGEVRTLWSEML